MCSTTLMINQTISGDTGTVTDRENNGGHNIKKDFRLFKKNAGSKFKVLKLTKKVRDKKIALCRSLPLGLHIGATVANN